MTIQQWQLFFTYDKYNAAMTIGIEDNYYHYSYVIIIVPPESCSYNSFLISMCQTYQLQFMCNNYVSTATFTIHFKQYCFNCNIHVSKSTISAHVQEF